MTNYQGKDIVIVGLGLTGLSCVDFFLSRGVTPKVMDTRTSPPGIDKLPDSVQCHCGGFEAQWLLDADLIIASPGVAVSTPQLQAAAQAGAEIIGDIELFAREVTVPVVAITGSNGKSTVTSLVGEMGRCAGLRTGVGGNIGLPALELLKDDYELCVLELSSFQLETTFSLKPAAATVLNVTEDHMDRYPQGLEQYRAAKLRVYHDAAVCVYNAEDALTLPGCDCDRAEYVSFGVETGDYWLDTDEQALCFCGEKIINCSEMILHGQHNYCNALAALALADAVNIPREGALKALRTYSGLPHRFQLVHESAGIRWIDDSKATNVGSTEAALNGLQVDGCLHLLLGGDGKSADFSPLLPYLSGEKIRLYCFGRDGEQLAQLRPDVSLLTDTMEQAMRALAPSLAAGDMVLLSPACASLDQFRNFEERGREFARLARELAA